MIKKRMALLFTLAFLLAACTGAQETQPETPPAGAETIRVVATSTILGDVVQAVGGDSIDLTVLFPRGTDVHHFDPTAEDARSIADADIIFMVGLELDHFVEELIPQGEDAPKVVEVSTGIDVIEIEEAGGEEDEDGHDHVEGIDPHVWMDPGNVIIWVENIAGALADLAPARAGRFDSAAAVYIHSLIELDTWIEQQVAGIPESNRKLVTDHDSLGYFARRYDFEQVGFIIPGFSTLSESSAQDLSRLIDRIAEQDVNVIFVNPFFDPGLTGAIVEGTDVEVAVLYTGALTSSGEVDTYLEMMTYNVNTIVSGLPGE